MRLGRDFYTRNTILVARELLGKYLIHKDGLKSYKGKIIETEAYINANDDGAHFHKGLTPRTRIIDQEGGHVYIYNIYGMYQMFNIVTEPKGVHGAVLIRALEPIEGKEYMYENRYKKPCEGKINKRELINLTNGPAKLVMAFGLSKEKHYGLDLVSSKELWLEEGEEVLKGNIARSKRINIDYAERGKDYLLRFYIKDNSFVSKK